MPCHAVNNWISNADCRGLYRFEAAGLTLDDSGYGETLTSAGTPALSGLYKEGSNSVYIDSRLDRFYITDASLNNGFPLKSNDTKKEITICFWMYLTSIPTPQGDIIAKWSAGTRSIYVRVNDDGGGDASLQFGIGYNNGDNEEKIYDTGTVLAAAQFYHVGITFRDSDKAYRIRIWDDVAGTAAETTGNTTNNINVEGEPYIIFPVGGTDALSFLGRLDELVFLSCILTADEIDAARGGTYTAPVTGGGQVIMIQEF